MSFKLQHEVELHALFHCWPLLVDTLPQKERQQLESKLGKCLQPWVAGNLFAANDSNPQENPAAAIMEASQNVLFAATAAATQITGKITPLTAVFSKLQLQNNHKRNTDYIYHPAVLTPDNIFPTTDTNGYLSAKQNLQKQFAKELSSFLEQEPTEYSIITSNLLALIEKYAWCYPANHRDNDISLLDMTKAMIAISSTLCMYHTCQKDMSYASITDGTASKFLLLGGDVSGIQKYIFEISSTGVGGVAKRLRARSFFISTLSLSIAHKIVHDFDLPAANILMQAGGNFYVLLPNIPPMEDYIAELRTNINKQLFIEHGGDLFLNLAHAPITPDELQNYPAASRRTRELLANEKMRPLATMLQTDSTWQCDEFVRDLPKSFDKGYCACCGKLPGQYALSERTATEGVETRKYICPICQRDLAVGRWLPRAKTIAIYDHEPSDIERVPLPGGLWVVIAPSVPQDKQVIALLVLNNNDLTQLYDFPAQPFPLGSYVPTERGEVMDFDAIARWSTGKEALGILKADVDNLGALFALGLGHRATLARTATMSRMLEVFFGSWLTHILTKQFPNTYLVYSGGDDILAIGPWDATIELAKRINAEFARFVGYNPDISLSVGINLMKPKHPIAHGVAVAEELLERSKDTAAYQHSEAKSQLTALGETIKWSDLDTILAESQQLSEWLNQDLVPSAFVYRLLIYSNIFQKYRVDRSTDGLRFVPLLTYDIARNLARDKQEPVKKWAYGLLSNLHGNTIYYLSFICRYVLLQRREG